MRWLIAVTLALAVGCDENGLANGADASRSADAARPLPSCDLPGIDPACGTPCTSDGQCPSSLHCASGKCMAECVAGGSSCGTGNTCAERGQCVPVNVGLPDAGECARVDVNLLALLPTVVLLIDQSGSMANDFSPGTSRWRAMRTALTDSTNGVVTRLQSKVRFGATLYTGRSGSCPKLTSVDPALNAAAAIRQLLNDNGPVQDTPTGESLQATTQRLHDTAIEGGDGPRLVVLATDGEPDSCAIPGPRDEQEAAQTRQLAVDAARAGYRQGIPTYVLSVGTEIAEQHLQDMANAGSGATGGANAPFYVATSPGALVQAFDDIVRGARTCRFILNGSVVPGTESSGEVILNGQRLAYLDPNGWKLVDAKTLELNGSACATFMASDTGTLTASFGCGSIIPGGPN
ncbi:MAG: VWA domain-containing protein [Deltaproteobacteria bacterium]|nr:VWA domain-containing protein [Deltaproteobacteria bacterium]